MAELPKVEIISAADVAELLHTQQSKIHAAIHNGTFPVGLAIEGGAGANNRTIIVKARLEAWLTAQDLKGA